MSRKELSPFAPDRWIRELNRLEPNLWQSLRKSYEEPQRSLHGYDDALKLFRSTPDWCVMPTMFPFFLLTRKYGEGYYLRHMEEMMSIATMYTWRISKGVYRFAPEIYEALVHQPLTGDLPCEFLHRLPEWAVYIESPGLSMEGHPLEGFIAHLDYNWFTRETDLQFAIFAKGEIQPRMVVLPLSGGTLLDAMRKLDAQDEAFIPGGRKGKVATQEEYRSMFSSMLQLLLYLCSEEPDMPAIEHPRARTRFSGGYRVQETPRIWDVGVRVSAALRRFGERPQYSTESSEGGSHASPRPHVRSAHWHTYWTGHRDASFPERKPVLRWLPPMPICMDWKHELPTNVRTVAG